MRKIKKKQKPQAGKATLNLFVSMLVGLVTAGLFCTTVYVFATPPASKYTPGETLTPTCAPGSTNCSVLTPVTYTGATAALDLGANNFTTTGTGTFGTSGILGIDAATNTAGQIKLWSAGANDYYTTFTAGTQTANATYTLPTAMPSGSSKFLQSTSGGVLSWESSVWTLDSLGSLFSSDTGLSANFGGNYDVIAGYQAGYTAVGGDPNNNDYSIIMGYRAGYNTGSSDLSDYVNFLGYQAGYDATSASYSNFLGTSAGNSATSASYSNFLGYYAGNSATNASNSNFLGASAGNSATNASNSNFLGYYAGYNATSAYSSNFLGNSAGSSASSAYYSNFLGFYAGSSASSASYSNFLGYQAGSSATSASYSNFLGYKAGYGQTSASYSVFIGSNAGNNNNQTGQTDFPNRLIIDQGLLNGNPRTSASAIQTNALLYGTFAAAAASQQLTVNAATLNFYAGVDTDLTINFTGTTNSGVLKWMEDEDYFQFNDDIFINDAENIVLGTSTGTKIGTSTSQKLGFFNATPVVQQLATADLGTALSNLGLRASGTAYPITTSGLVKLQNAISVELGLDSATNTAGQIKLWSAGANDFYTTFTAGTQTANATYTLPTAMPGSNKFLQSTSGGVLSWESSVWTLDSLGSLFSSDTGLSANFGGNYDVIAGYQAGYTAVGGSSNDNDYSIIMGYRAGYNTGSSDLSDYVNFLGYQAGYDATSASYSNFLGTSAGNSATSASYSNFLGYYAGNSATNASYSNFLGSSAGNSATSANNSNFFGYSAGQSATSASYSNFLGPYAGYNATSASNSNFLGSNAGYGATSASSSNFLGNYAGYNATSASYSNFFGTQAGYGATSANNSNFLGQYAGQSATSANNSNFLGYYAGNGATSASYSNFLGSSAGNNATNAFYSNFLGVNAGQSATSANNSNFLGSYAGYGQTSASYSVFIGSRAGNNNNLTGQTDFTNNLIIDQSLLGSGARATAAAIRTNALLYGTFAAAAADQQLTINAVLNAPIVYSSTNGGSANVYIDSNGKMWRSTSSLRYKENIQPLATNFNTILQIQPKTFTYKDSDYKGFGYVAEDFDALGLNYLVSYDDQGRPDSINYDKMSVYLSEVVKQQQLDIQEIQQRLGITSDNLTVTPAGTVGSGEVSGVAPSSLLDGLKSVGINIIAGVANFTEIVTNKMTATTAKINGLEMVDKTTGQIYCTYIDNGEWQKVLGECTNMVVAQATQSSPEEAPTALTATQIQQVVGQVTQQITPDLQQAAQQAQQAAQQAQQASQRASQANQNAQQAADQAQQAVEQFLTISSVAPISDINVDYGTDLSSVNLPATATVTLSDTTTQSVNIFWDNGTPTYDPSTAGNYVFQGTIVPLSDATNTQSLKAQVNVIVAPQEPETPTQEEITPTVGDLIEQGVSSFINSAWQFAQWTVGASVKKVASFMPAIKNATANLFQAFQNLGASLTWPVRNLFSR